MLINKLLKSAKDNDYQYNKMDCLPVIYRIQDEQEREKLSEIITNNIGLCVLDEIYSQLQELIKLRNPNLKLTPQQLEEKIKSHLNGININEYGVWVHYPWNNTIVHLLDEDEFIEVRTNRNQYKITPEEELTLSKKKIGIIGLSVGKAIALTIALERICGELVLADFDVIELSNLNRIQTGVHHFNVKKTVVVAREIAEIDPFLKVTCYHEGITEANIDDFFTKDRKLDICIEVCDGLTTKIEARQKAKHYQIPVVMNSSDRGTTDIERFDLNPDLPILHGLIDHLDLSLLKQAKTNEEKVPYLLPMLGIETSSERLKASMLEIEETITTWPQLASGVIFGGGICTDVCRRILLNQFTNSGRYFVDTEKEINDEVTDYISANKNNKEDVFVIPNTSLEDYKEQLKNAHDKFLSQNNKQLSLTKEQVGVLIEFATMAPSGGNVQPWKWIYRNSTLLLFNDVNRSESILNYKKTASLISLGAATENLLLKAKQMGLKVEVSKFPLGEENELICSFQFYPLKTKKVELYDDLVNYVKTRITNRTLSKKVELPEDKLCYFNAIVETIPGANLKLFTDNNKMEAIKDILAEVDKLFMTNKAGHSHFIHEIRWNKKEVEQTRDGIDINTIDLTPTERAGLIVSKNWNVTKHIKKWNLGNEFGKLSRKAIDASSALGVITMPAFTPVCYFDGGRAVQKMWLAATKRGVAFQPMSINTFLFAKVGDNNFDGIEEIKTEMIILYDRLKKVCNISNEKDVFFFRLAKADEPKIKALRRHLNDVLIYEN